MAKFYLMPTYKNYLILFLVSMVALTTYSQDCEKLDKASFFKSIKPGSPIPPDLRACAGYYSSSSGISLHLDKLDNNCKKKYAGLLGISPMEFEHAEITINNKGEIYSIWLWTHLPANTTNSPEKFMKLYDKLVAQFGKPTSTRSEGSEDSIRIKYSGVTNTYFWGCNTISMEMKCTYGTVMESTNMIHVIIKNRKFELIPELETLPRAN
jgi:hypothetical protein